MLPYIYEPQKDNSLQFFFMNLNFTGIDGMKIAWQEAGNGKPLVILHGWGSSSRVMMPVATRLGGIRKCYVPDLPGFGDSPEPQEAWGVSDYAVLTEKFINLEIPEGSVDLLVHSFGARVAIKLLCEHPVANRIDKVIFTGAAGLKPKRTVSFYLRKYTAKLLKFPFLLLPGSLREKGLNRLRKTSIWKKLGSADYQQLSGVMRETFVRAVSEHLDGLLPSIQHEILLIWGENDESTPLDQAERMDRNLPKSTLIVMEQCGHYAFLDKPKQFAAIAQAYLEP